MRRDWPEVKRPQWEVTVVIPHRWVGAAKTTEANAAVVVVINLAQRNGQRLLVDADFIGLGDGNDLLSCAIIGAQGHRVGARVGVDVLHLLTTGDLPVTKVPVAVGACR